MRHNRHYLFDMSYLKVFAVLTEVEVDVSKFFGVRAWAVVLKPEAGVESESEKCDSTHIWCLDLKWPESFFQTPTPLLFQNVWIWGGPRSGNFSNKRIRLLFRCQLPSTSIQPKFTNVFPKKWPWRLLLLPKIKSDSGSGFSLNFDTGSGSERKTKNNVGVDSGTPDPCRDGLRERGAIGHLGSAGL